MTVATTHTVSLQGMSGHLIDVQADVSSGLVGTAMVGRPDTSITEARDRCRAALTNSGLTWPATKRVTILLDTGLIEYFKARAGERGYQTLINDTLRQAKERETLEETLRRVIREELQHDTRTGHT